MAGGRPTKLTPELQEEICQYLADGHFREVAAQAAGIAYRTLAHWCRLGKSGEAPYAEFLHAVQKAEQRAELAMLKLVMRAAEGDAKHAEWFLERKYPERWGRDRGEITELKRRVAELEKTLGEQA